MQGTTLGIKDQIPYGCIFPSHATSPASEESFNIVNYQGSRSSYSRNNFKEEQV